MGWPERLTDWAVAHLSSVGEGTMGFAALYPSCAYAGALVWLRTSTPRGHSHSIVPGGLPVMS